MARTIEQIKAEIYGYKNDQEVLNTLNSGSLSAIYRIWIHIVALAIYTVEVVFDNHRSDMVKLINEKKPHTRLWYRNKALAYQYGQALIPDTDVYDNTGLTDDEVLAKKVVKYAAAIEAGSHLIIKVAGEVNGARAVLTAEQYAGLVAYLQEIKDGGVILDVINSPADYYRVKLDIYYDPMIMDGQGNRLDGSVAQPVQTAIKNYIGNLPFNGEYSNVALVDVLQKIEGVIIPELLLAETKYGLYDWTPINAKVTPDAGYLKVYDDADLVINWKAYAGSN